MRSVLAEQAHLVNILPPVDITGGATGDIFSMANHNHATIVVQVGVSAAAFTKIILNACDDFVPSNATALAFNIYKCETSLADVVGAKTAVAAAGLTPSANDNIFYVIEIDAADLPAGKPNLQLSLTNGANSVIASAFAILTGARFAGESSATAIA